MPRNGKLTEKDQLWLRRAWHKGLPVRDLESTLKVCRATLYRYAAILNFEPHPLGHHEYLPRAKKDKGPVPTMWRCWCCEGRCDSPTGHARCAA